MQYRFKGDFELEMQFVMSDETAMASTNGNGWHTWIMSFYANSGSIWDNDWILVGNGIENDGANDHNNGANWTAKNMNANFTSGYDKRSAIYGATVTLKVSRLNGYLTVSGIAEKDGKITAYYTFYSKDLNYTDGVGQGNLWVGGRCTADMTIQLSAELCAVDLKKLDLISGENYK